MGCMGHGGEWGEYRRLRLVRGPRHRLPLAYVCIRRNVSVLAEDEREAGRDWEQERVKAETANIARKTGGEGERGEGGGDLWCMCLVYVCALAKVRAKGEGSWSVAEVTLSVLNLS